MAENPREEMVPFLSVVSNNFEKDLGIVRKVLAQFEERTHTPNGYRLSERAEMAAGWWFYDILVSPEFLQRIFQTTLPPGISSKKNATIRMVDVFQEQMRKNGSEAKIKMHGDMPFAAPWWAWLMR